MTLLKNVKDLILSNISKRRLSKPV